MRASYNSGYMQRFRRAPVGDVICFGGSQAHDPQLHHSSGSIRCTYPRDVLRKASFRDRIEKITIK